MEFCSCYDFCQLFHIGWLDINDIEALVLNVQVPKIDSEVIATNERFPIAVH
jgi:hypothetical protein